MTPTVLFRLLAKNWKWLVLTPLLSSIIVFMLTSRQDKEYSSSLEIYTGFASGYSITSTDNQRFDYYAVNNALDNLINTIKSDAVLEKVGLRLFAQSLIYGKQGDNKYITPESYDKLIAIVPNDVIQLVDYNSVDSTVSAMQKYMNKSSTNFIFELINLYHPHYSLWALSKIKVAKIGQSDLLSVNFTSNDPAICYQTLNILSIEFIQDYRSLREFQTTDVMKYFEDQLAQSSDKLSSAEDRYMKYNKNNRIINYYEQTKSISGQLEAFELNYDKLLIINNGAAKAAKQLENRVGLNSRLRLASDAILAQRNRIADRTAQITSLSIFADDSSYVHFNSSNFDIAVNQGKQELRRTLDSMDMYQNSPDGIEIDNILNQWLDQTVQYDASTAALKIMDERRLGIDKMFDFYAPVGASVKRQERELGIIEKEYLSLLRSLGEAKLRQQEIEMLSSALRVVDDPIFPISAEPSKRKMMSIMAFIVTFILILALIVIIELFDRTLHDALRAKRFSGLDVIGLVPLNHQYCKNCIENLDQIALSQVTAQIIRLRRSSNPTLINLISNESGEGKSYISNLIKTKFTQMGYTVQQLTADENFSTTSREYIEAQGPLDLLPADSPYFDIYITELPQATIDIIPNAFLETASLNLFIARANRAWHSSDTAIIKSFSQYTLYMILNGVQQDSMEVFTGEIPKKRSAFRRFLKRIVSQEFSARKTIV